MGRTREVMVGERLPRLFDVVRERVWYHEHGLSDVLTDSSEWSCWHVEIFKGDEPLACAYGETPEVARDRAEVIVRAMGMLPPARVVVTSEEEE